MAQCSRDARGQDRAVQHAGVPGRPPHPEWPAVEERTIALMRYARLRSYNDYRERVRPAAQDRLRRPDLRPRRSSERLAELYGDIDQLEWYVGIFAEDYPDDLMMGELLTAMVGNDAFTQALTNPLLAPQVFTEATFTRAGMKIIRRTRSLQQILARNAADPARSLRPFHLRPGASLLAPPDVLRRRDGADAVRTPRCPDGGYGLPPPGHPYGGVGSRTGEDRAPSQPR